jgi:hypothetical protein
MSKEVRDQAERRARAMRVRRDNQVRRRPAGFTVASGPDDHQRGSSSGSRPGDTGSDLSEQQRTELAKLDEIEQVLMAALHRPHQLVRGHTVILDPLTHLPIIERDPRPWVVAGLVRLSVRRAMLLGLDAPRKREVGVVTEAMLEELIRKLDAESEALEADAAAVEAARRAALNAG